MGDAHDNEKQFDITLSEEEPREDDDHMPECPGWMVTFGDAVSLLLTFFVLLLSFSEISTDEKSNILTFFKGMGTDIRVMGGEPGSVIDLGEGKGGQEGQEQKNVQQIDHQIEEEMLELSENNDFLLNQSFEEIANYFNNSAVSDSVQVSQQARSAKFEIILDQTLIFSLGRASLKNESKVHLERIAQLIADIPNDIFITGIAADIKEAEFTEYTSELYLSIVRANKLTQYFINVWSIDPERIAIHCDATSANASSLISKHDDQKDYPKMKIAILGEFNGYERKERRLNAKRH